MTDDQHRIGKIAKAEIEVTHLLDTAPADATHERQAAVIIGELQKLGWRPPLDPTDTPPLRPTRAATGDSPGRQAFRAARQELAARKAGR